MAEVTTLGTLLINDALPKYLRKQQHVLDKKGVHKLLSELAATDPEQYKSVLTALSDIGKSTAWTEGMSVSLAALRKSKAKQKLLAPARARIFDILEDDRLTETQRKDQIVQTLLPLSGKLQDAVLEESRAENSPFATQIVSGARGSKGGLSSLRGADLLATDQNDRFIPLPLLHSYAEGFTPAEYFAASYGQRKGALAVKMSTADAGFLNKQLVNAVHRQVVTHEQPYATRLPTGLPVDTSDRDNIGAVLAIAAGKYKAGTVLTDEILQDLEDEQDEIVVHSPMTEISEDGGVSALAVGRRTNRGFHQIGDNTGIPAAQAIGERLSQGALGAKHSAGVNDRVSKAGFEYINRMIQSPEHFPESGPLAEDGGVVQDIRKAPQGGQYLKVGDREYYIHPGIEVTVKVGDTVEQGDELTDGTPHPEQLVRLRGIGDARREYLRHFREALDNSGVGSHRRNLESVVSGLINWAKITDPDGIGDNIYGDVAPYGYLAANYKPRSGAGEVDLGKLKGMYLEEPVLHYTPGTRVNRHVLEKLKKHKIQSVFAHKDPPGFKPHMVRGLLSVYHDPDWRTQQAGFYTARAFSNSLHRGAVSDTNSTSFVPALAEGVNFGKRLTTQGTYGG